MTDKMTHEPTRTDHLATLVEATDLLNIELPDRRWADETHLEWLYRQNPFGDGVFGFRRSGDRLDAHYALVPQEYRDVNGPVKMMFSLNAVTRGVAQRSGHFWSIGEEVYARAAQECGAAGIIGVSNDNSTPPVVKRLGWRLMGPLPVRIIAPLGSRAVADHTEIGVRLLAASGFEDLADSLDHPVSWGWRNRPTSRYLRWRLASPNTAPYHLHLTDELLAISVASHLGPASAAVVLKLLPRRAVAPGRRLDAGPLARSIIGYHRAAFGVYAGFNARVRLRGIQPPRRLQPAPLNLIFRPLPGAIPAESFRLETYEFLDMDAY